MWHNEEQTRKKEKAPEKNIFAVFLNVKSCDVYTIQIDIIILFFGFQMEF